MARAPSPGCRWAILQPCPLQTTAACPCPWCVLFLCQILTSVENEDENGNGKAGRCQWECSRAPPQDSLIKVSWPKPLGDLCGQHRGGHDQGSVGCASRSFTPVCCRAGCVSGSVGRWELLIQPHLVSPHTLQSLPDMFCPAGLLAHAHVSPIVKLVEIRARAKARIRDLLNRLRSAPCLPWHGRSKPSSSAESSSCPSGRDRAATVSGAQSTQPMPQDYDATCQTAHTAPAQWCSAPSC